MINEINPNTKAFFDYANKNRKSKSKIGPLKQGNTFESGPQKMADILSMQYRSVFSKPKTDLTNLKFKSISSPNLEDIELTKKDFLAAMKNLSPSSAPGPDSIPAFFYKDYAEELVYLIMKIWRISLDTGLLPEGTAQATITLIYKGGDKGKPANYRLVTLTNHLTKIFESSKKSHCQ